jgi:hypothetical protein
VACLFLSCCSSSYDLARQKLAAGDYQGASSIAESLPPGAAKTRELRAQIDSVETQAKLRDGFVALSSGSYEIAHGLFAQVASKPFSQQEESEAAYGLCVTEFRIGPPTHSLEKQHATCSDAAAWQNSLVSPILMDIDRSFARTYLSDLQKAVSRKDWQSARNDLNKYSDLSTASPEVVSEWKKKLDELELPERLARAQADQASKAIETAAESRVRESAKASFCRAMEMAFEYEDTSGLGRNLRASGMDENRIKTVLWTAALKDVGQESIVPLIQDLADENSVSLHTSGEAVTQEWFHIVNLSMQGGGPRYCSN